MPIPLTVDFMSFSGYLSLREHRDSNIEASFLTCTRVCQVDTLIFRDRSLHDGVQGKPTTDAGDDAYDLWP